MANRLIVMESDELEMKPCYFQDIETNLNIYKNHTNILKSKLGINRFIQNNNYPNDIREFYNYLYSFNENNCKYNNNKCHNERNIKYNK